MTVPSTTRRAGPYLGNGVTTSFPFTFKVFAKTDIALTLTNASGISTALVLDSDYSVTLNADQDSSPGGSITYPISGSPMALGYTLVGVGAIPYDQTTSFPAGGPYRAETTEDTFDRTEFQIQQLAEGFGRSLTLPPSAAEASAQLPVPVANNIIGWDETAQELVNYTPSSLATVVVAGTSYFQALNGDGTTKVFTLTADPGSVNALDIAVNGVPQKNGIDFTCSGTTLTFTDAPSAGTQNIAVRYVAAVPVGSANAQDVTYLPGGTGAVTRTAEDKLREFVSVKDYGAAGDGVTNDRAAIVKAFTVSKSVYFPAGTYYLGAFATADSIIDLSAFGDGIAIHCDNGVELVVQTTASVMPRVFYLLNNNNFSCDPIRIRDTGYDPSLTWKGAIGFYLDCNTSTSWGDVKLPAMYAKNLVAAVQIAGGNATARVRGIKIGQLLSDDCYYGYNGQNNGDGVEIGNLVAYQNYRPYYVYGCSGHRVKIFNRAARSTSGAVNIARAVGGLNTSGLDITYVAREMTVGITHVLINHIDLLGGEISNIKLNLDIRSTLVYSPLRFVNYTGSGGSETSSASSNYVYDVTVSGSCDGQASAVSAVAAYASRRQLNFLPGLNFFFDTSIPALFTLGRQARGLAPTWTASVNPALGNGTLSAAYDLTGGMCAYTVSLTAGSTTTFGTGDWIFSAPFAATADALGSVWILDNGTQYYVGVCKIVSGAAAISCYANAASGVRSTVPMTWANGDQLQLTITYPIG